MITFDPAWFEAHPVMVSFLGNMILGCAIVGHALAFVSAAIAKR